MTWPLLDFKIWISLCKFCMMIKKRAILFDAQRFEPRVRSHQQPEILLIDELDKMNAADTAALLSLMEGGRLVRAKRGRELNLHNQLTVVAASNRLNLLSPELKSRFAIRTLSAYSREDFLTVVRGVLVSRENLSPEVADEIAALLDGRTHDVRDAIRAARLVPQLGVTRAVNLLMEGRR